MKRFFLIIIACLVIIFISLFFYVRSNAFRTLVSQKIHQMSKGKLTVSGSLHLSFYPVIGLSMDKVVLKNPNGFGDKPLFKFDKIAFSLRLAPLFLGKIIPATLVINKGDINLIRNQKGLTNWNAIFNTENSTDTTSSFSFLPKKVDIKHVNLYFHDLKANQRSAVLDINFKLRPSLTSEINDQQYSKNPLISKLDIQGVLTISNAQFENFQVRNIRTVFEGGKGVLNLTTIQAALYNGRFKGNITANFTKNTPMYELKGTFQNINVQQLLKDLIGYQRIVGTGYAEIDLTTTSLDPKKLTPALNGHLKLNIKNGNILGINFPAILNIGTSLLKTVTIIPRIADITKQKTTFGSMRGTGVIRNGILTNNDLRMITQDIEANGKGKINLVNKSIQYVFEIRPQGKTTVVRAALTGPLGDPNVKVFRPGFIPTLLQSLIPIPGPTKRQ